MGNKTEKSSIAIYRISGPPLDKEKHDYNHLHGFCQYPTLLHENIINVLIVRNIVYHEILTNNLDLDFGTAY